MNDKGSIGETVKELANSYSIFSEDNYNLSKKKEVFESVYNSRRVKNRSFPQSGDMIIRNEFDDFYKTIINCGGINFIAQNDLAVLIYAIILHESRRFRQMLNKNTEESRVQVFELIHEITCKYAPNAVVSSKDNFVEFAENMFTILTPCFIDLLF